MISKNLAADNIKVKSNREIIAIIAYLQQLGTDIKSGKIVLKVVDYRLKGIGITHNL